MNDISVRYSHIGEAEFASGGLFSSTMNYKMSGPVEQRVGNRDKMYFYNGYGSTSHTY